MIRRVNLRVTYRKAKHVNNLPELPLTLLTKYGAALLIKGPERCTSLAAMGMI